MAHYVPDVRTAAELCDLLRSRGLKATPQRLCVLALLEGDESHPTAEQIHVRALEHLPTLSLRTVYQALNELVDAGELLALDMGTGATRFDPRTAMHHHVVCRSCGAVRDIDLDTSALAAPAPDHGFLVSAPEVLFRGLCAACQAGHDDAAEPHYRRRPVVAERQRPD